MLQLEARAGSLKQQLGPEITEEGGSVRSQSLSLRSIGGVSNVSSTSSRKKLARAELERKKAEAGYRQRAGRLELEARELERQGELAGLEAEFRVLDEEGSTGGSGRLVRRHHCR